MNWAGPKDHTGQTWRSDTFCFVFLQRLGLAGDKKHTDSNMPPKKANADLLLLKLKRHSSTYIVDVRKKNDLAHLKAKLVEMINTTGGLPIVDKPITLHGNSGGPPDIEMPIIGVADSDSESDSDLQARDGNDESKSASVSTDITASTKILVKEEDITLGLFSQLGDIHSSNVTILDMPDSTKIDKLNWQDFIPIAFKHKDEEFKLYRQQYE